jgi:hypothetical protein
MSPYHPGWLCFLDLTLIEWVWTKARRQRIFAEAWINEDAP